MRLFTLAPPTAALVFTVLVGGALWVPLVEPPADPAVQGERSSAGPAPRHRRRGKGRPPPPPALVAALRRQLEATLGAEDRALDCVEAYLQRTGRDAGAVGGVLAVVLEARDGTARVVGFQRIDGGDDALVACLHGTLAWASAPFAAPAVGRHRVLHRYVYAIVGSRKGRGAAAGTSSGGP